MRSAAPLKAMAVPALVPLLGCWLLAASVWAGEARLVEGADRDRVVIEATDATADEVLDVLATRFGFVVESSAPSGQPVRFSGRLQGSLDEIVERLLRHQGHMIVRSADARGGIARVVLIEGKGTAPAPIVTGTIAGPIAAIKAKVEARQREEAGR